MKFDNIEIRQIDSVEEAPAERKVRKRRKINVLDFVIVQLVLCVAISAIVLTARVVTSVSASKNASTSTLIIDQTKDMY